MSNLLLQPDQQGILHHGGRLRTAAVRYAIPLEDWLDLSTGINPDGWPVKTMPASIWARLPEDEDELNTIAGYYYGTDSILPVAGSQAAIQALPQLRKPSRVNVLNPGYAEHAHAWQRANHSVSAVTPQQIESTLAATDVLVIIHPNNPTGDTFPVETILAWHAHLARRGGWLVVDEAFIDATPEHSIVSQTTSPGLIVLRSLGKFFGLAGARVGFVCAQTELLAQLNALLGPWTISTPARWVASQALQDKTWQKTTRQYLIQQSRRLQTLLVQHHLSPDGGCALFQWVQSPDAQSIHDKLAHQGILTRCFKHPSSLRFGLPRTETDWQRLDRALANMNIAGMNT